MNSPLLTLYHGSRKGISGAIRPDLSDGAAETDRMRRVYAGYHTVSYELAVKWLKEDR